MRNYIHFFVNGVQQKASGADAFLTLSDFLRKRLGLCGTKIVCSEGDCGSCSVLCSGIHGPDSANYIAIDSCIRFVFQLDGCHIVTVEGIGSRCSDTHDAAKLHPVQQAMVDCHGSQCGFCTPGFVVAMAGILEQNKSPTTDQWRHGLTGNLCRCTGYSPIIAAGLQAAGSSCPDLASKFDTAAIEAELAATRKDPILVESQSGQSVSCPTTIEQAIEFLAEHPDAKVVAGGTDVGVQFNKGHCKANRWLDLNRISALFEIAIDGDAVTAGACARWSDMEQISKHHFAPFHPIIRIFGSPQIRNVGTIGGNIINASPIADSLPFLLVCGAQLHLTGASGSRSIDINDFYSGYKTFDLKPGELLTKIHIPIPPENQKLQLYKVSRRLDMDISTFTAAIAMNLSGETITDAKIAMGAVGPVVLRLEKTEAVLAGKPFTEQTMHQAGELAVSEITPISDVRGTADFRLQLARNVFLKFYHESQEGVLA